MDVEETLKYLRDKGNNYLTKGNEYDDEALIARGEAYLELASELAERLHLD